MGNWNEQSKVKEIFFKDKFDQKVYSSQVGKLGVTKIVENKARGEGDKWNYEVYKEDGFIVNRVFDIVSVTYFTKGDK